MRILGVKQILVHQVETDERPYSMYTRYSSESWTVRVGESDEPVYSYNQLEALEAAFQSEIDRQESATRKTFAIPEHEA